MFYSGLTLRTSTHLCEAISGRYLHTSLPPHSAQRRFKSTRPQLIFFGSDSFSCVVLKEIIARRELWDELHVVTPPIARKGRGLKNVYRAPLLDLAQQLNISSEALSRVGPENSNRLQNWDLPRKFTEQSDHTNRILITASFPYFIPKSLIKQFPASHCLNIHPSHLPLYRGPAPIQWQLANQINPVGVTIQDLSPDGFDLGDILAQQSAPLPPNTAYALAESFLGRIGGSLMCKVLQNLPFLIKTSEKQDSRNATKARKILQTDLAIGSGWDLSKVKSRYLGMGHQYPLNIRINSNLYFVIPDFLAHLSQHIQLNLQNSEPGTILFDKKTNLIGMRLWNESGDVLAIKSIKLAAAGGKGWVEPRAWWDSVSSRSSKDVNVIKANSI